MANNLEKLPVNASEALDNLKRRYSDLRTSVTNINSLPEPLYRMRRSAKRGKAKSGERHKVAFMRYGYYDVAFRFFVEECLGAEFVRLPEPTRKSLELGTLNSNDYVCAPFKHILGDSIEALERGADTLVQFSGPCRLHYYGELQESILRDMGYEFQMVNFAEVAETSAKQNIEYCKQGINPDLVVPVALPKFMVTLEMIECLDRFNDAYLETAGFEANPGECKRVRKAYLADMYRVKNRAELHAAQKQNQRHNGGVTRDINAKCKTLHNHDDQVDERRRRNKYARGGNGAQRRHRKREQPIKCVAQKPPKRPRAFACMTLAGRVRIGVRFEAHPREQAFRKALIVAHG